MINKITCLLLAMLWLAFHPLLPVRAQIATLSGRALPPTRLDAWLQRQMDSLNIPGLSIAIINKGEVVYHRTFGLANIAASRKVDEQTVFEAASLTKPLFGYFVMKMVEKGVLHLDTPLYRYLPNPDVEYDERYKLITARMALSHTTGFPNWRFENAGMDLDIRFLPGSRFSYSGEGYDYLGKAVARLTHTNTAAIGNLLAKEVFIPTGMPHAYVIWDDSLQAHIATGYDDQQQPKATWRPKVFNAASSLQTEALSYARFLIAIIQEKGLKKESFEELLRAQVTVPEDSEAGKSGGWTGYGLGFALKPSPYGMLYLHSGTNWCFQSEFMICKARQFGYVFFVNNNKGHLLNKGLEKLLTTGE